MKDGWFPVHRQLQEHWLWEDKPFSKGQAWIDLLMLANYKDTKVPYKGEIISCKTGDVNVSISRLSSRWGWSRHKARDFLNLLESDGMITVKATTNRTTVTIENYIFYSDVPTAKGQRKDSERTAKGQRKDTTNNINNINNINKEKEIYKEKEKRLGEFENVILSEEELEKLKERFPYDWQERIENLSQYMSSKGKRYKSHYATILAWARKDDREKAEHGKSKNQTAQQLDDFYDMAAEWAKEE